jgi:hypothetical protein
LSETKTYRRKENDDHDQGGEAQRILLSKMRG